MESEKDIEALKYALAIKLGLFNQIRNEYDKDDQIIEEKDFVNRLIDNNIEVEENLKKDVNINELTTDASKVISNDEDKEDEDLKVSSVPVQKFGTSFFGRRRR